MAKIKRPGKTNFVEAITKQLFRLGYLFFT
jgi:hypothetical protein